MTVATSWNIDTLSTSSGCLWRIAYLFQLTDVAVAFMLKHIARESFRQTEVCNIVIQNLLGKHFSIWTSLKIVIVPYKCLVSSKTSSGLKVKAQV